MPSRVGGSSPLFPIKGHDVWCPLEEQTNRRSLTRCSLRHGIEMGIWTAVPHQRTERATVTADSSCIGSYRRCWSVAQPVAETRNIGTRLHGRPQQATGTSPRSAKAGQGRNIPPMECREIGGKVHGIYGQGGRLLWRNKYQ